MIVVTETLMYDPDRAGDSTAEAIMKIKKGGKAVVNSQQAIATILNYFGASEQHIALTLDRVMPLGKPTGAVRGDSNMVRRSGSMMASGFIRRHEHDEFACRSKGCAPPPAGVGGSNPKSTTSRARRAADDIIGRATKAEPRITSTLQGVADKVGGEMVGLDHRLKTSESLARKIKSKAAARGIEPEEYAAQVSDASRYTMQLSAKTYVADIERTMKALKDAGMPVVELEQQWAKGTSYNAVHAIAETRNGTKVEIQFHTEESLAVKAVNHEIYEKWRSEPDAGKRAEMSREMTANSDALEFPAGLDRLGPEVRKN